MITWSLQFVIFSCVIHALAYVFLQRLRVYSFTSGMRLPVETQHRIVGIPRKLMYNVPNQGRYTRLVRISVTDNKFV